MADQNQIQEVINRIQNDQELQKQFGENPVKAIESLTGIDLPDEQINDVIKAVSSKLGGLFGGIGGAASGAAGGLGDAIGGLFGGKKEQ